MVVDKERKRKLMNGFSMDRKLLLLNIIMTRLLPYNIKNADNNTAL